MKNLFYHTLFLAFLVLPLTSVAQQDQSSLQSLGIKLLQAIKEIDYDLLEEVLYDNVMCECHKEKESYKFELYKRYEDLVNLHVNIKHQVNIDQLKFDTMSVNDYETYLHFHAGNKKGVVLLSIIKVQGKYLLKFDKRLKLLHFHDSGEQKKNDMILEFHRIRFGNTEIHRKYYNTSIYTPDTVKNNSKELIVHYLYQKNVMIKESINTQNWSHQFKAYRDGVLSDSTVYRYEISSKAKKKELKKNALSFKSYVDGFDYSSDSGLVFHFYEAHFYRYSPQHINYDIRFSSNQKDEYHTYYYFKGEKLMLMHYFSLDLANWEKSFYYKNGEIAWQQINSHFPTQEDAQTYTAFLSFPTYRDIKSVFSRSGYDFLGAYRTPKGWCLYKNNKEYAIWSYQKQDYVYQEKLKSDNSLNHSEYNNEAPPVLPIFSHVKNAAYLSALVLSQKEEKSKRDSVALLSYYLQYFNENIHSMEKSDVLMLVDKLQPLFNVQHVKAFERYAELSHLLKLNGYSNLIKRIKTPQINPSLQVLLELMLDEPVQDQLLFSDSLGFVLHYYQDIKSYRKDVDVVSLYHLRYDWYRAHIEKQEGKSIFKLTDSLYNHSRLFDYMDPYHLENMLWDNADTTLPKFNWVQFMSDVQQKGVTTAYQEMLQKASQYTYHTVSVMDMEEFGFAGIELLLYYQTKGISSFASDNYWAFNVANRGLMTSSIDLNLPDHKVVEYYRKDLQKLIERHDLSILYNDCVYDYYGLCIMSKLISHYTSSHYENTSRLMLSITNWYKGYFSFALNNRMDIMLIKLMKDGIELPILKKLVEDIIQAKNTYHNGYQLFYQDLNDYSQEIYFEKYLKKEGFLHYRQLMESIPQSFY